MPGVTVLIDENKEILCKGELNILGSKEKKVQICPTSVNSYFNSIFSTTIVKEILFIPIF